MELEQWRARVDAFHTRFNAAAAAGTGATSTAGPDGSASAPTNPADDVEGPVCGGCLSEIERDEAQWCGACRCTAYCSKECQRIGWKAGGHKAACKLLARARALPPADPGRRYVVQLKLEGRQGLLDWATQLEAEGQGDVAAVHREMAEALAPRERVLFALEARCHVLLRFQLVPATKRLEAPDLALFALQAVVEPAADVPSLNMRRDAPQRPYAIWIPGSEDTVSRSMARPVGQLLAGAGLPTATWYVGGGFCAEAKLRPDLYATASQHTGDVLINAVASLDPDRYSEDEEEDDDDDDDDDDDGPGAGEEFGSGGRGRGGGGAAAAADIRVLIVAGMHMFGPTAGEGEDPLLDATARALRSRGAAVEVAMYPKASDRRGQEALAQRLTSGAGGAAVAAAGNAAAAGGGFAACVVLGLGSGSDFKPRKPTSPWGDGPWRTALVDWVRGGGVLVMHGERAAAAVAREFFGLRWGMEGDYYRRTDHKLNRGNPLLGDALARQLPEEYNVKACMLSSVPPPERVYATPPGARTHSLVPFMAGEAVDAGRAAMAAARVGGGAVAFFGDVNWEEPTMEAVASLTQRLVIACQRRAGSCV